MGRSIFLKSLTHCNMTYTFRFTHIVAAVLGSTIPLIVFGIYKHFSGYYANLYFAFIPWLVLLLIMLLMATDG